MSDCSNDCTKHSGLQKQVDNLEKEMANEKKARERIDAKLNMILGAIIVSPFLWSVLTGVMKTGKAITGG